MSQANFPITKKDRALIFDMDGILIDSEPLWRRAEVEIFASVGLMLRETDCLNTQGLRIDEAVAYWYGRSPWTGTSCEEVAIKIVSRVDEHIRREGQLMTGAEAALDWAATSGWRLALASSSTNFLIGRTLDHLGIRERFEIIRSAEDEIAGKPAPDVYLSTARALRLDPSVCVAIEDSANGVASAVSAGMQCIAVPMPEERDDPRFGIATTLLPSLDGLADALQGPPLP